MHNLFRAISISYKNTPIDIREQVSLDDNAVKNLIHYFKEYTEATDVLVLSTCNRTEVYYSLDRNINEDIIKLIGIQKGINDISKFGKYFVEFNTNEEAVGHLFNVSIGLEAQVVGDMQITNQVKRAYQLSADEDVAGPFLHRLMHTIFFTNKRVTQETPFRDGAASVSYATTEIVKDLVAGISNPKILIIGLGEIGADVCRNLASTTYENIYITNRTHQKAVELANECDFQTLPFENVVKAMKEADVVISSISMQQPFITRKLVDGMGILSHKFFFDLSVPRSIEDDVEEVPGALLYNIDDIRSKANKALEKRIKSVPLVEEIVSESVNDFNNWSDQMVVSPTIQKLKNALEEIRQREIAKHIKNVDSKESKIIDKVTKGMMQKIIKLPVLQLKAACKRGEAETLIDVLNDLFDLERSSTEEKA
ncbi:glutamyl-tRNA reductase [Fulvivirgaceae bacterium BMA10]|uniref:Glutamyl-tRNA reductase n=1 Tax=Splendidivirga corallicola TaxID=3051826 RepID=A0ABT8L252_9BACT|nr:glutamyl-tRNA reductase [Fulvivirgaceae bacterium BMA10]